MSEVFAGFAPTNRLSPLVIADRLLDLAQEADRAGFTGAADRLLRVAYDMYDEKPFPFATPVLRPAPLATRAPALVSA